MKYLFKGSKNRWSNVSRAGPQFLDSSNFYCTYSTVNFLDRKEKLEKILYGMTRKTS